MKSLLLFLLTFIFMVSTISAVPENTSWLQGKQATYLADASSFSYHNFAFKTGTIEDVHVVYSSCFVLIDSQWINLNYIYSVKNI